MKFIGKQDFVMLSREFRTKFNSSIHYKEMKFAQR